jgi:multidrug resistance protein, MATE family
LAGSRDRRFWLEARTVLTLAVPVAIAELGWVSMNVVDTIMVGGLGPAAIGAIAVGGSSFYTFGVFGLGLLLGLDTLVSQSCGAGDRDECYRCLAQGTYLALFLTPILMCLFALMPSAFALFGIQREVAGHAGVFIRTLSLSTLPLLLYGAFRRYLQGVGHVRPVMAVLISANLINWFFNWLLIEGRCGFRAMGVAGSALSTCLARAYMAGCLGLLIVFFERRSLIRLRHSFRRPDWTRLKRLLKIGFPAATQILLEIGAFGSAAVLAGRLAPVAIAAHQIAINAASLSFMIPLGISSAAAVAVGQAVGRGDMHLARERGFIAIGIASLFAVGAASLFFLEPTAILYLYTSNQDVVATGITLLALAASFQLFDGVQVVATGALRGIGETRIPMLVNLAGYWFLGLPVGVLLCFELHYGVFGLWIGLTLALCVIAVTLLFYWHRYSRLKTGPKPALRLRDESRSELEASHLGS